MLEAVQLDAFGRRDRGSLDAKRHPQVQQTLMDRLAKALGVEARERTAGERGREVWEKHLTTCWFLNVICSYLMFVGYTRDGTSRHGDYFVSQLNGSLLRSNQFNDAGFAIVPEMLGGGGAFYTSPFLVMQSGKHTTNLNWVCLPGTYLSFVFPPKEGQTSNQNKGHLGYRISCMLWSWLVWIGLAFSWTWLPFRGFNFCWCFGFRVIGALFFLCFCLRHFFQWPQIWKQNSHSYIQK